MNLNDRFMNAFAAGTLAGIIMDIVNFVSYKLNIAEVTYWEWASVLIYGYRTTITFEILLALILQIFFSGIVGVTFAYLIMYITSKHIFAKGIIVTLFIWFSANAITYMLDVSPLIPTRGDTVISNIVTTSIYGLALAMLLNRLEYKHN